MNMDSKVVILGLSGGVDSAVAAHLLRKEGLTVVGLYFDVIKRGQENDGLESAQEAAQQLGVELLTRDVTTDFAQKIIGDFCQEYAKGRTPNPCIRCNPAIKFRLLYEAAEEKKAAYIATGHYARTGVEPVSGKTLLRVAACERKDQSYMLYRLPEDYIKKVWFPLGDMESKDAVRSYAQEQGLKAASKGDSQEICFLTGDYADFLQKKGIPATPGDMVDGQGQVVAQHRGLIHYTIGQRKGLGTAFGVPLYVTGMDVAHNQLQVGKNEELFHDTIAFQDPVYHVDLKDLLQMEGLTAKIRYAAKRAPGRLEKDGLFVFEEPQRAPAPGQSIVIYKDDFVVGGGIIA